MSLIDNLRGTSAASKYPGAPQAPIIAEQLEQARATLADLEARHDQASLDAYSDAPGAKAALAMLNADVIAARDSVALLQSAHRGAVERDKIELLRQYKDQIATAHKSAVSNLVLRDNAGAAFAAAIAEANKQYRLMHRHTWQAYNAWTLANQEWPSGAISESDLKRMAADESWRYTTSSLGDDPHALPGATFSKLEFKGDPKSVPDLETTLRQDTDWIKEQLAKVHDKIGSSR